LQYSNDGRATGEGYVSFENAEAAKAAMLSMNRKMMGSRYIELFVSSKEEHRRMSQRNHIR
jgi:RNA recognition motif-containing protein